MVVEVGVTAFAGVTVVIVVGVLRFSVYCVVVLVVGKKRATTTNIDKNTTTNTKNNALKHIN